MEIGPPMALGSTFKTAAANLRSVSLSVFVLLATAWLATTALVAALCWVAGREWLREHNRSQTTVT